MNADVERTAIRKIYMRLLPLLFISYFVCYLDRINVGFAALTMNKDLGFTATVFALGATAFFWGYCLFEVPSNLVLEKVGARIWIARIMITWGLFSGATAFVTGATSFATVRFFLGVSEAGFFPGMILYFTYWFPARYRGRVVGWFMTAIPVSIALGSPISTAFLYLDGLWGLPGWSWLFIAEAIPAVVLGFVVLFYLTDRPAQATWLTPQEREWLVSELQVERAAVDQVRVYSLLQSLVNPRVLALAVIYLGIATASVGLVIFLPQIIKQHGLTNMMTGFATAIPYVVGTIGMIVCGYITDRMHERRWNLFFTCIAAAVGLFVAALLSDSLWALAGLSLATVGFYGMKTSFWPLPSTFMSGTAAAAAIAAVNSLGNFGGLIGPIAVGWLKDTTGSFGSGLYFLAACGLVSAAMTLIAVHERYMPSKARVEMAPAE
ncbi:MAG: MFS transporter [Bradyrhizobiaceae bacterium]|nr:MFS transporter [Hyphomicrobiales bacterium]MBV9426366.1 MFS transporter [Bradyrhizobiaceae bacterium]